MGKKFTDADVCYECKKPAHSRWGISGSPLCRTHYMRRWRSRPPFPNSAERLEDVQASGAPSGPCSVCRAPSTTWVFDCWDEHGDSMTQKDRLLYDGHRWMREDFRITDYTQCCGSDGCRSELDGEDPPLGRIRYLELLVAYVAQSMIGRDGIALRAPSALVAFERGKP